MELRREKEAKLGRFKSRGEGGVEASGERAESRVISISRSILSCHGPWFDTTYEGSLVFDTTYQEVVAIIRAHASPLSEKSESSRIGCGTQVGGTDARRCAFIAQSSSLSALP